MSRARSRVAYLPERASRYVVSLSLAVVVAACAAVPPLDDAKLVEITRASADDMARYANAVEVRSREEFGGASFSDSKGHVIAAFSASEYDAYQAYLHVHSGQPASSLHSELSRRFPILRLTFQSSRVVFDPDAGSMPVAMFSLCGADANDFVSGMRSIIWNGRFVTPERAREIEKLIKTGRPQTYEILFNYIHWKHEPRTSKRRADHPPAAPR